MKCTLAAIAMMVLVACSSSPVDDSVATGAGSRISAESATAATTARADPETVTVETGSDVAVEASTPSVPSAVCLDDSPIEPAQIGTVNTIVVPESAGVFDGAVVAVPDTACPGDVVSFVVSIVNTSDDVQHFAAGRGLIFSSGGMAKWSLAALPDLEVMVQPGEHLDETVTGTIPPVAEGTYRLSPEGAGFFGEITVLNPNSDTDALGFTASRRRCRQAHPRSGAHSGAPGASVRQQSEVAA